MKFQGSEQVVSKKASPQKLRPVSKSNRASKLIKSDIKSIAPFIGSVIPKNLLNDVSKSEMYKREMKNLLEVEKSADKGKVEGFYQKMIGKLNPSNRSQCSHRPSINVLTKSRRDSIEELIREEYFVGNPEPVARPSTPTQYLQEMNIGSIYSTSKSEIWSGNRSEKSLQPINKSKKSLQQKNKIVIKNIGTFEEKINDDTSQISSSRSVSHTFEKQSFNNVKENTGKYKSEQNSEKMIMSVSKFNTPAFKSPNFVKAKPSKLTKLAKSFDVKGSNLSITGRQNENKFGGVLVMLNNSLQSISNQYTSASNAFSSQVSSEQVDEICVSLNGSPLLQKKQSPKRIAKRMKTRKKNQNILQKNYYASICIHLNLKIYFLYNYYKTCKIFLI